MPNNVEDLGNDSSVLQKFGLHGRVAVVTGAAGQLGQSIVRALWEVGANVALLDQNIERCESWVEKHIKPNQLALAFEIDVVDEHSVQSSMSEISNSFGQIDILINNAGIGVFSHWKERTLDEFRSVLDTNLQGTFICIKAVSGLMEKRNTGVIINIASVYGVVSADPRIYMNSNRNSAEVYAASKAGVIQLTKYYAVHLAPYGIRVNAISPGGIFNDQADEFIENYIEKTPLKRMATPDDINGAIIYLASTASAYVTGHNLIVDGGLSIW